MAEVSIVNAKKSYGNLCAIDNVSLKIPSGEFFGLLGPNGAGKSTLINAIVGLVQLNSGHITIDHLDTLKHRQRINQLIGFAPQDINLDRFFSIRKILLFQAGFYGVPRSQRANLVDQLLEQMGLEEKSKLPYYKLSGGMQKRLLIAKALIGSPKFLILDEPTAGVDVKQRHQLWKLLRELNQQGTTILLTTHYIDEAEELCDRIGIIHKGKIREIDSPLNLIERYCTKKITIKTQKEIHKDFQFDKNIIHQNPYTLSVHGQNTGLMIEELIQKLKICNNPLLDLHIERGSLEDVFLQVTGEHI